MSVIWAQILSVQERVQRNFRDFLVAQKEVYLGLLRLNNINAKKTITLECNNRKDFSNKK